MKCLRIFSTLLLAPLSLVAQLYHPVEVTNTNQSPGKYISRTMHLLESCTVDEPGEVRIMIYGQSITRMEWWLIVREFLFQKYPDAGINMQNFAIGGFQAERLIRCVERDVLDFYPDLIIFHDYGGEETYEEIIRMFRTLTATEVMVLNDHIGITQNQEWHDRHSWEWLPSICEKYGLEFIDVRSNWIQYAEKYGHDYQSFLRDQVHMNSFGNYLMAEIIKAHFVYDAAFEPDPANLVIRSGFFQNQKSGKQDRAVVDFMGNRLDLIYPGDFDKIKNNIFIDGTLMEEYPGSIIPSRAYINSNGSYPQKIGIPVKIELHGQPVEDHWRMVVTGVEADGYKIHFNLFSKRYGFQGSGDNLTSFCSDNHIICLETENWFYRKEPGYFSPWEAVETGDTIQFEIKRLNYIKKDPQTGKSTWIIKGLPPGDHELRIEINRNNTDAAELKYVIYNPPLYNSDR